MTTEQEATIRNQQAIHQLETMLGNGIIDIPTVLQTLRGRP